MTPQDLVDLFDYFVDNYLKSFNVPDRQYENMICRAILARIESSDSDDKVLTVGRYLRSQLAIADEKMTDLPSLDALRRDILKILHAPE